MLSQTRQYTDNTGDTTMRWLGSTLMPLAMTQTERQDFGSPDGLGRGTRGTVEGE